MGASYGGYAALAGGAFTPDLYRCVISVNGVSNLPKILRSQKFRFGSGHWINDYLSDVVGDAKDEQQRLKDISPINHAADFRANVLLLHGRDDTVVPYAQSQSMFKALRKAGKQVRFVALKEEDHWLSDSDTRIEMLRAISTFVQEHNPAVIE